MEEEKLENLKKSNNWGGARENAGRALGGFNKTTLEKQKILKEFQQAILKKVKRLLKIHMGAAEGEMFVYRIDEEEGPKGGIIRTHVLVEDPHEIETFMNEHDFSNGEVEDSYYYIKTKPADWHAIADLYDRVFGKATQSIEIGESTQNEYEQLSIEDIQREIERLESTSGETEIREEAEGVAGQTEV